MRRSRRNAKSPTPPQSNKRDSGSSSLSPPPTGVIVRNTPAPTTEQSTVTIEVGAATAGIQSSGGESADTSTSETASSGPAAEPGTGVPEAAPPRKRRRTKVEEPSMPGPSDSSAAPDSTARPLATTPPVDNKLNVASSGDEKNIQRAKTKGKGKASPRVKDEKHQVQITSLMPPPPPPTSWDDEQILSEVMLVAADGKEIKRVRTCKVEDMFPRKPRTQSRLKALVKSEGNFPAAINLNVVDPLQLDKGDGHYITTPPHVYPVSAAVFAIIGVVTFNALELSATAFSKQLGFIPVHNGWGRSVAALGEVFGHRYFLVRSFAEGLIAQTDGKDEPIPIPEADSKVDRPDPGQAKESAEPSTSEGSRIQASRGTDKAPDKDTAGVTEAHEGADDDLGDDLDEEDLGDAISEWSASDAGLDPDVEDSSAPTLADQAKRREFDRANFRAKRPRNWDVTVYDGRSSFYWSQYDELPQLDVSILKPRMAVAVLCTIGSYRTTARAPAVLNRNNVKATLQFNLQSVVLLDSEDPSSKTSALGVFQPDLTRVNPDAALSMDECIHSDRVEQPPRPRPIVNERKV